MSHRMLRWLQVAVIAVLLVQNILPLHHVSPPPPLR